MFRVGLTGGIACGKSSVLEGLHRSGLATLDLDRVAHDVMAPGGAAYPDVVAAFGPGILARDGSIDRQALGAVVFADPEARSRLDSLVHPRVRAEEARRAAAFEEEGCELLVSDAALLVEAGVHLRFDRLVVVHCTPDQQLERLRSRDGIGEEAARARVGAQMPIVDKRRFAHLEIDTSGSLADTAEATEVLAGVVRTEARGPRWPASLDRERALGALAGAGERGPRGLGATALLGSAVDTGGLEMRVLAGLLEPAVAGPWYAAARPDEKEPWPEALSVPLALWALARGRDEEWLVGAAASLARLTHAQGEATAGAVLAAQLARAVALGGSLRPLEERSGDAEERARRWGGASPPGRVHRAFEAALAHRDDPAAAGDAAGDAGAEPALARSLVGMAMAPRLDPGETLVALVDRLGSI